MNDPILDYFNSPEAKHDGRLIGIISLFLTAFIPFSLCIGILFMPVVIAAFTTGVVAIAQAKGRSIMGWISITISGIIIAVIGWAMLVGRL